MPRHPPVLHLWLWRARIPLTVLTGLVGAVVVVDALRPAPEPHTTVLVSARALEAGTVLDAGDVRAVRWPERLAPEGASGGAAAVDHARGAPEASAQGTSVSPGEGDGGGSEPGSVVGRSLAVAVPAGMPLLAGVLAGEEWWGGAPPGSVAAPVRLSDAELAGLLRTGDRVDVYAASVEGGAAERLAHRALVLAGPSAAEPAAGGLFGGAATSASGLVLVAVTSGEAAGLAGHAASSVLSVVLVQ